MLVEGLDQARKVGERAGQPVDLVGHDDIDTPRTNIGEQALQGRALHRGAGDAPVIVGGGDQAPALVALAADISFTGLALGMQRVELLLQSFLGGFAGVDRAALPARVRCWHRRQPRDRGVRWPSASTQRTPGPTTAYR